MAKLERLGPARALAALQHTMENGWQGIYEPNGEGPKDGGRKSAGKTRSYADVGIEG